MSPRAMWVQLVETTGKERPAWIFLLASLVHLQWGILLLLYGPQSTAPLTGLLKVFGSVYTLGGILIATSLGALSSRWKQVPPVDVVVFTFPQQILLLLSLVSRLQVIFMAGQWQAALVDQLPAIMMTVVHTGAFVDYCAGLLTHKWGVPAMAKRGPTNDLRKN